MAFKLAFWKKDPEIDAPIAPPEQGLGDRTGLGNIGQGFDNTGLNQAQGPGTNVPQGLEPIEETPASQPSAFSKSNQPQPDNLAKNIEIISSKVDTIKAVLDNLAQKIDKIEKIAEGEQEEIKREARW